MARWNFRDPVKEAFGRLMGEWHAQLSADTSFMVEYARRPFAQSCVWAPGRMIDQVDDMLKTYRKNDNSQRPRPQTKLPIVIAAMSRDLSPSQPDYGRNVSSEAYVMIPGDAKERVFAMRVSSAEYRTQIAIMAPEEATAHSISMQLNLWFSAIERRNFSSSFPILGGLQDWWPVQISDPELMAIATPPEEDVRNLVIKTVDVTLRASIPVLRAPGPNEASDGKGAGANQHDPFLPDYDPSGFPVVLRAHGHRRDPASVVVNANPTWSVAWDD